MSSPATDAPTSIPRGPLAFSLLLLLGLSFSWIRDPWAPSLLQAAFLSAGLIWGSWSFHPLTAGPLAAAAWAAMQALSGQSALVFSSWVSARDWLALAAVAALSLRAFDDKGARRWMRHAFLVGGLLLSIQAVLQNFTSAGKVFWLFPSGYEFDVFGPFTYRNRFAFFVELLIPLALWGAFAVRPRRVLYLIAAAFLFSAVVASGSRTGFFVALLEIAAAFGLAWHRRLLDRRELLACLAPAALVAILWVAVTGAGYLQTRFLTLDPMDDYRISIQASTLDMIGRRPWFGYGLGAWSSVYPEFARFDAGAIVNQAHNDWLQWAAEGGIPFGLLMLLWAAGAARAAWRTGWGLGLCAVFLHAFVDYPFQQSPAFSALLVCFAGLTLCAARDALSASAPNPVFHRYQEAPL